MNLEVSLSVLNRHLQYKSSFGHSPADDKRWSVRGTPTARLQSIPVQFWRILKVVEDQAHDQNVYRLIRNNLLERLQVACVQIYGLNGLYGLRRFIRIFLAFRFVCKRQVGFVSYCWF